LPSNDNAGRASQVVPLGDGCAAGAKSPVRRADLNLMVPITLFDELSESIIKSTGTLDLASGEIRAIQYEDHDIDLQGLPADDEDYEFTSGTLSHRGKEIEFRVDVDVLTGKYSVTPSELLELKGRAAKLFTAPP
jgi:hypothetical protein